MRTESKMNILQTNLKTSFNWRKSLWCAFVFVSVHGTAFICAEILKFSDVVVPQQKEWERERNKECDIACIRACIRQTDNVNIAVECQNVLQITTTLLWHPIVILIMVHMHIHRKYWSIEWQEPASSAHKRNTQLQFHHFFVYTSEFGKKILKNQ